MKESNDFTEDDVVMDGIRFLETLARVYGSERAQEVWQGMGREIGNDIKGRIFFAMLTGETSNRVFFSRGTCDQAVSAIKAIRVSTGLGLKEAKDLWDLSNVKTVSADVLDRGCYRQLTRELRELGMKIH